MLELLKEKDILEYYGIYEKRELTDKEKNKYLKIKKEIQNLIQTPIERMYIVGENAWGKVRNEEDIIYIALDKRIKDLNNKEKILKKYFKEKHIFFLLTSLCSYEKRKDIPTEQEYFIARYGIEIYNSGKDPSINENLKETEYAAAMLNFNRFRTYIGSSMKSLVRIYILKLGMPINKRKANFEKEIEIIKRISKDKKIIALLEEYQKSTDKNRKKEITNQFLDLLKATKQVKYEAKLKNKPTMEIYEKLLKEKNKLDIKNLTKEELYIMYVIQKKRTNEIASLYGVERDKIDNKRNYYNIKSKESIIKPDTIKELIRRNNFYKKYTYAKLKNVLLDFEKYIMPILNYMKDGETYLLKEFWKFCQKDKNSFLDSYISKNNEAYYKAELCMDFLLQNELIKEVEYKQYKITPKGKNLLKRMCRCNIEKTNIPIISKYLPDFKYFELEYKEGYPTSIEEISNKFKELKEKMEQEIEKENYTEATEKIEIEKWILAFLNTIFNDKKVLERIKKSEDIKDFRYMLHSKIEGEREKINLKQNIISAEIYKYIENIQIKDIVKFAIANYKYFNKNITNIKIEKIGE